MAASGGTKALVAALAANLSTGEQISTARDDAESRIGAAVPLKCADYIAPDLMGAAKTLPKEG